MQYYQRIKNIREDKDIRQYKFAERLNLNKKTYNLYENGIRSIPYNILSKILREFDISLDYLLELTEVPKYDNLSDINEIMNKEKILEYRKKLNFSQVELSTKINVSQQTISEYERGNCKIPLEVIKLYAEAFNISSDTLTGRTNTEIKLSEKIKM